MNIYIFLSHLVVNPCESYPCKNGGECSTPEGSRDYICECPTDFTGRNCQIPKGRK